MERLEALAEEIDWQQGEDGLALFANEDFGAWYRLPFAVDERVAVDRTFEVRDILYTLHRLPRYRVLVFSEQSGRLLEGTGSLLDEVRDANFPMTWTGARGAIRGPEGPQMQRSNGWDAHVKEFLTDVARALGEASRAESLPLVLIAPAHVLPVFNGVSAHGDDVAVMIDGFHADASVSAIAELAWPRFEEWLHAQRQVAVDEVAAAEGANRLAAGTDDAWKAARGGQGHKLVVEEGFRRPAILKRDGWELDLVPEEAAVQDRAHLDDAVDELIEMTLEKGGAVEFVDEDSLADRGRVALILRY
ncbi:MAG: hypothetical protein WD557_05845 [Dehalococcoidia bacterium]